MIALVIGEGVAEEVVERVLGATGYARANTDQASLAVELGRFGEVPALRVGGLGRGLLTSLARELAESSRVDLVAIDSLGGEEGTAWGLTASRRRVVELDANEALQELIDTWLAESEDQQRLYLDHAPDAVLDALASELLGLDAEFERVRRIRFASEVPERLVPVVGALAGGASFEWTELAGQPAIRVALSGTDSILKALDPAEVTLLQGVIDGRGRR